MKKVLLGGLFLAPLAFSNPWGTYNQPYGYSGESYYDHQSSCEMARRSCEASCEALRDSCDNTVILDQRYVDCTFNYQNCLNRCSSICY